jgi:hypothetical protein
MSSGETDQATLLRSMRPVLREGEYVFCSLPHGSAIPDLAPLFTFREDEGLTVVVLREIADTAAISYVSVFRRITLSVHSSLDAVGFLAAVTTELERHGISANAVSAYYHDHLFVPADRADEALAALLALTHSS